jgi:hypothetical protein
MAIAVRAHSSYNSGASTTSSFALNVPSGTLSGDMMIANIGTSNGTADVTPPSGWTKISAPTTTGTTQAVYYRVAGSSEPASYTWTCSSDYVAATCVSYSGVDTVAGIANNGTSTGSPASTHVSFSSTAVDAESAYPVLCGITNATTEPVTVTTASSGWTTEVDASTTSTAPCIESFIQDQHAVLGLPLGSVSPGVTVMSATIAHYCSTVITLRPIVDQTRISPTFASITTATGTVSSLAKVNVATYYDTETLYLFWIGIGSAAVPSAPTISGGGLTWTQIASYTDATNFILLLVFSAPATSPLSPSTINAASGTTKPTKGAAMVIYSLINAGFKTPIGASGGATADSEAITTLYPNSWVWALCALTGSSTVPTIGSGQTNAGTFGDSSDTTAFAIGRQNSLTASPGTSVTSNWTTGTDVLAIEIPPLISTDTGSGADAATLIAATLADTGSGADGGESLAVSLPDSGSGADAATLIAVSLADTGSGADAGTLVAATLADSGSGSDAGESIAGTLSASDSGSGADTGSVTWLVSASDSGSGTDAGSIVSMLPGTNAPDIWVLAPALARMVQALPPFRQVIARVLVRPVGAGPLYRSLTGASPKRAVVAAPPLCRSLTAPLLERELEAPALCRSVVATTPKRAVVAAPPLCRSVTARPLARTVTALQK